MEEYLSRNIGTVMTDGGSPDLTNTESDSNSVYQIYDINAMTIRMIGSVKVALIPSINVSETKATVRDVPQINKLQSKGRNSTVSPEELSERWQIVLEQEIDTITKTTQRLTCSSEMPLTRRYKADRVFQTKRLTGKWATYTMDGQVKSLDGNRNKSLFYNWYILF